MHVGIDEAWQNNAIECLFDPALGGDGAGCDDVDDLLAGDEDGGIANALGCDDSPAPKGPGPGRSLSCGLRVKSHTTPVSPRWALRSNRPGGHAG